MTQIAQQFIVWVLPLGESHIYVRLGIEFITKKKKKKKTKKKKFCQLILNIKH